MRQMLTECDIQEINLKLVDDFTTLRTDSLNGKTIDFPMSGINKVYRAIFKKRIPLDEETKSQV